jgi:hypothetical protein
MDLPAKVKESLQYLFYSFSPQVDGLERHSFSDNVLFQKAIKIEYGDSTEIPLFCCSTVSFKLPYNGTNIKNIYIPLIKGSSACYKTTNRVFNYILKEHCNSGNISHVKDGIGNEYYGCPGIILNKDRVPILMSTVVIDRSEKDNNWFIKSINIRIHPCVYNSPGPIEKLIVNKVIPYFSLEKEYIHIVLPRTVTDKLYRDSDNVVKPIKVSKIEISEDIEKFFFSPNAPTELFKDEDINKMLFDHADEIFNL